MYTHNEHSVVVHGGKTSLSVFRLFFLLLSQKIQMPFASDKISTTAAHLISFEIRSQRLPVFFKASLQWLLPNFIH